MLRDWSETQKQQLLDALRAHGVRDIAKLTAAVSDKSQAEVELAIAAFEKLASASLKDDHGAAANKRKAPIDGWLEVLKHVAKDRHASDDIANTMRLISQYGRHDDHEVKLKDCYEYIADLMMGKAPKELDTPTMQFLIRTVKYMARNCVNSDTSQEELFLSGLKIPEVMQKTYGSKKVSVIGDPSVNILKVPKHLLNMKLKVKPESKME